METRQVGIQKGVPSSQSYDPDTSIKYNPYNDGNYYGRKQIIINASLQDFYENPLEIIKENISYILSTHKQNVEEMEYLRNYYRGKQDILEKVRSNGEQKINNKHVTNYAWEYVNFKKGYYVGKPIKYVDVNEEKYNDIKYLNCYLRDVKKPSKDLVKYENMLITGIAYTMTIPNKKNYNIEFESPFTYTVLDNKDVCVVRSNDVYKTKLFTMYISTLVDKESGTDYKVYVIYYDDEFIEVTHKSEEMYISDSGKMPVYECITEYQLNEQRMGVFEPILSALNSLNNITSNQLDQLEEMVNSYLTFENVDISELVKNIDEFRRKRILAVETNNPETPAKIGSIKIENEHSSINNKYKEIEQRNYDIIGVPMPTSSTGQGVSGEAQVYGGGWENAQIIALVDTQYILQYEQEDLNKFIYISKDKANSKTPNLYSSNLEIKYTINKSNNMMVKAQSMTYFIDKGFTREQALTFCEITDDPQSDGKLADENYIKQKEIDLELELKRTKAIKELNQEEDFNKDTEIQKKVVEKE